MRKFMLTAAMLCVATVSLAVDIALDLKEMSDYGAVEVSSVDPISGIYDGTSLVDGNSATMWASDVGEPHWAYLDWSTLHRTVDSIIEITVEMYAADGRYNAQDFTLQTLNPGADPANPANWTTVDTVVSFGTNDASSYIFTPDPALTSQGVRLHITDANTMDEFARIFSLQVDGFYDFTGNIASLAIARAGSEDGILVATRVNDEDYTTRWDSGASASGEWVYLDWGAGNTVSLDEVVLHTVGGSKERYSPENVEIQTYDGTGDLALDENWTTVGTLADFGDDPFAVFEFAPALETRALRVDSGSDGETDFVRYWEIETFGTVTAGFRPVKNMALDLYDSAEFGTIEANDYSAPSYHPKMLVDGKGTTMWNGENGSPYWAYLDWSPLHRTIGAIDSITVDMRGANGLYNAQDFTLQTLNAGANPTNPANWTTVDTVVSFGTDNKASYTFAPATALVSQGVRLNITDPSTMDDQPRIFALDVIGSYDFTGNIASLATAVAGSDDGRGFVVEHVNDEDYTTRWDSAESASGEWVYLDWGVGITASLDEVVLHTVGGSKERYSPENVEIQAYDGTGDLTLDENWTTVDTLADFGDDPFAVFEFATALETRALRVDSGSDGETDFVRYWEIETFGTVSDRLKPLIVGLGHFSGDVYRMEINFPVGNSPSLFSPMRSANLITEPWDESITHSTNGVDGWLDTGLDYSVSSGSNRVIYVQSTDPSAFFGLGDN